MKYIIVLILLTTVTWAQYFNIMTEEWKPYQYEENNIVKGIRTDAVNELLKRLNIKDKIKIYPWARAYYKIINQENQILFEMTRNAERENLFKWVGPLTSMPYYFFYNTKNPIIINNLNEAKKYKIGVYNEDISHQVLLKYGFENIDISHDNNTVIKKLEHERVDLIVMDEVTVHHYLKSNHLLKSKLQPSTYGMM